MAGRAPMLSLVLLGSALCSTPESDPGESVRMDRRAFDGAPPVIGHPPLGAACIACHDSDGIELPELGMAPPNPHTRTSGLSRASRCGQCHVFRQTSARFVPSDFVGLKSLPSGGKRAHVLAPPTVPHPFQMRENCLACHAGPASRPSIRTSHPERTRCRQCHVSSGTSHAPEARNSAPVAKGDDDG